MKYARIHAEREREREREEREREEGEAVIELVFSSLKLLKTHVSI